MTETVFYLRQLRVHVIDDTRKISQNHFSPAVHKGPQIVFFFKKGSIISRDTVSLRDLTNFLKEKKQRNNSEFFIDACTNTVLLIGEHDFNN